MYKNEYMDIPCADAPSTHSRWEHPPNPNRRENLHMTYQYPWNLLIHKEVNNFVGGATEGEAPHTDGSVREVFHMYGGPLTNAPQRAEAS